MPLANVLKFNNLKIIYYNKMFKFNKKILERYRGSVFQKPKRGSKEGKEYYDRISFNTKAKE